MLHDKITGSLRRTGHGVLGTLPHGRAACRLLRLAEFLGIFPLQAPFLKLRLEGMLLKLRGIPNGFAVSRFHGRLGAFALQFLYLAVGCVFDIAMPMPDGAAYCALGHKLRLVGSFGAHIFLLYLPQLAVQLSVCHATGSRYYAAGCAALAAGLYFFRQINTVLYLASFRVYGALEGRAALFGQILLCLLQLTAQHLGFFLGVFRPFLRREFQALTAGGVIRIVDIALPLHADASSIRFCASLQYSGFSSIPM